MANCNGPVSEWGQLNVIHLPLYRNQTVFAVLLKKTGNLFLEFDIYLETFKNWTYPERDWEKQGRLIGWVNGKGRFALFLTCLSTFPNILYHKLTLRSFGQSVFALWFNYWHSENLGVGSEKHLNLFYRVRSMICNVVTKLLTPMLLQSR